VSSYKANQNNIPEAWADAYRKTDTQVGENKILYSGTTTVTALIRKKNDERWLHCANVGDARAVLACVPLPSPTSNPISLSFLILICCHARLMMMHVLLQPERQGRPPHLRAQGR
jgi:hypothetical protein